MHLPSELFLGLNKLESLILETNRICFLESSFDDLVNLKHLIISGNWLSELRSNVFRGLKNLEVLKAKKNSFNMLLKDSLQGLDQLKVLDLRYNKVEKIEDGAISNNCPLIRNLKLTLNKFESVPFGHFLDLKFIQELFLSADSIHDLELDKKRTYNDDDQIRAVNEILREELVSSICPMKTWPN